MEEQPTDDESPVLDIYDLRMSQVVSFAVLACFVTITLLRYI